MEPAESKRRKFKDPDRSHSRHLNDKTIVPHIVQDWLQAELLSQLTGVVCTLQGIEDKLPERLSKGKSKGHPDVTERKNKTYGLTPTKKQFICSLSTIQPPCINETRSAFFFLLFCLCKPFACEACPERAFASSEFPKRNSRSLLFVIIGARTTVVPLANQPVGILSCLVLRGLDALLLRP